MGLRVQARIVPAILLHFLRLGRCSRRGFLHPCRSHGGQTGESDSVAEDGRTELLRA